MNRSTSGPLRSNKTSKPSAKVADCWLQRIGKRVLNKSHGNLELRRGLSSMRGQSDVQKTTPHILLPCILTTRTSTRVVRRTWLTGILHG